ncbi:MAG TPA: hypothetical protein VHJ69_08190, partial [Gemmatimonadales bacterium]|nr:hypothetical protein [Gemmatimonadales bacterium]
MRNRLESTERTRIAHDRGITRISFGFTLAAGTLLVAEAAGILTEHLQAGNHALAVEQLVFLAIAGVVLYGNLVYQVTRL